MNILDDMGVSKLSGHFYSGSKLILYPYVVPNILFFCGNAEVDFRIIYFRWTCLTFTLYESFAASLLQCESVSQCVCVSSRVCVSVCVCDVCLFQGVCLCVCV